jgi:DNA-binding NtrC family response regulator
MPTKLGIRPFGRGRFNILLCGKKEMMDAVRRFIPLAEDAHLQFASSPGFLAGRALFNVPRLVLIDVTRDNAQLRSALKEFCSEIRDVPIIALAKTPDHSFAVELVKLGVSSYFVFPEEHRKIMERVAVLYDEWKTKQQKERFVELQQETYDFRSIVGESPEIKRVIALARKVIESNTRTVLITGETGTGKELMARAIHYNSMNRHSMFLDIACTTLPETLLEAELFGYERGAFTDAKERKIGLFELAGDGTIFLDEIGDISPTIQAKLLKVIEDRRMRRVGGVRDIPVAARVIAATSADLDARMKAGEFRKDLLYRLKILPLELPRLEDRIEDIPLLVESFLKASNEMYGRRIKGITPEALRKLVERRWEGNVRELKHAVERAVLLEDGDMLTADDFATEPQKHPKEKAVVLPLEPNSNAAEMLTLFVPLSHASAGEVQRLLARKVLERVNNNKMKASKILKISRPRLDRILRPAKDTGV